MKEPYSIEAEQNVIGSAMADNSVIANCGVSSSDFFNSRHAAIWSAIASLSSSRQPVDAMTVFEELERTTGVEFGLDYLVKLCHETASPQNGPTYAKIVRNHSQLRLAQTIGKRMAMMEESDQLPEFIRELLQISQENKDHTCSLYDAMQSAMDLLDNKNSVTTTGLKDLDDAIGGWNPGDLIVIAARPAMGKTAMMLNHALAATVPVGIVSGEQGRDQIGLRMIAIDQCVSLHHMRKSTLDDSEWSRITSAINASKDRKIWMYDKAGPSIDDVVRQARSWKYEKNIGVFMVDYLQKLRGGEGRDMRLQVGDITMRLKDLGRELGIPIVVLAQVKREVESRSIGENGMGRMPFMGDIAESAIIEQEADTIITLYRPEVYADEERFKGLAYVNICKARHGPVGCLPISWRGEFLKFSDLASNEMRSISDRWTTHSQQY